MGKYDDHKSEVLRVSQMLSENGYFGTRSGSAGNVSVLIEDDGIVAVTPHGKPYGGMAVEDICIVDLDLGRIEGELDPSVEAPLHVAVYKNRKDVNAVIHSHQIYASIFSILNEPIPPLFDEVTAAIGDPVEVVPYGVSGSPQLLENGARPRRRAIEEPIEEAVPPSPKRFDSRGEREQDHEGEDRTRIRSEQRLQHHEGGRVSDHDGSRREGVTHGQPDEALRVEQVVAKDRVEHRERKDREQGCNPGERQLRVQQDESEHGTGR